MFQAEGQRGRILAVYAEAATLGAWRVTAGEELGGASRFEARILWQHDLLLRHRPLTIALAVGGAEWRWQLESLSVSDSTLRGRALGAPVVSQAR